MRRATCMLIKSIHVALRIQRAAKYQSVSCGYRSGGTAAIRWCSLPQYLTSYCVQTTPHAAGDCGTTRESPRNKIVICICYVYPRCFHCGASLVTVGVSTVTCLGFPDDCSTIRIERPVLT